MTETQLKALKRCMSADRKSKYPFGVHYFMIGYTFFTNGFNMIRMRDLVGEDMDNVAVKDYKPKDVPNFKYLYDDWITDCVHTEQRFTDKQIAYAIKTTTNDRVVLGDDNTKIIVSLKFLRDIYQAIKPYFATITYRKDDAVRKYPFLHLEGLGADAILLPIVER